MIAENHVDVLARTIYGEARGELRHIRGGLAALIAVGNVVLNRVQKGIYGVSIHDVCLRPYQFSCWNLNDPNRTELIDIKQGENPVFDVCYKVSEGLIYKEWPDLTSGATHYHANWLKPYPAWTQGLLPVITIGNHLFYKL